jgi:selenocysteine-specific elongation factor
VRLHLPASIPLLPGDRYVLRESGRDETVGGGEVLDVAPVLPASKASPDRRWQRVVGERGWVDADELERLTGERIEPTLERWVVDEAVLAADREAVRGLLEQAGTTGIPMTELDVHRRAVVASLANVRVEGGVARNEGVADPLADHPVLELIRAGGFSPPAPDITRDVLRQLRQRGLLVERDGIWFHPETVAAAARLAAALVEQEAAGFTVSQFREAAQTSRKYALPLLAELDARGVTRRRDLTRIAGPRMGAGTASAGEEGAPF